MKQDILGQVENYVKDIEKEVGKGEVFLLGQNNTADIEWITTGSLKLTRMLGKGLPRGRIIEIYGPESGGKTTLANYFVSQAQKSGLTCAYVDTEQAYDPQHAKELGVNIDELYFSQPDSTEKTFRIIETFLDRIPNLGVIVVDSVASMIPQAELDGDFGDSVMGLQARLMSQALRKLVAKIKRKNVTVIFINQIRMKIGVMYGNPETTTGGNALKFYSTIRLDVRRKEFIGEAENPVGLRMRIKVVKNKVAPPFKVDILDVYFSDGIDESSEFVDFGIFYEFIEKNGGWFTLPDGKKVQGKDKVIAYYSEHGDKFNELKEKIWKRMDM